jgi:hypothetical protein
MCPALKLAIKRNLKVIGRTLLLINSTRLRNPIRYLGVFKGSNIEGILTFTQRSKRVANHKGKAKLKFSLTKVVNGKLNASNEKRFKNTSNKNLISKNPKLITLKTIASLDQIRPTSILVINTRTNEIETLLERNKGEKRLNSLVLGFKKDCL